LLTAGSARSFYEQLRIERSAAGQIELTAAMLRRRKNKAEVLAKRSKKSTK